MKHILVPTDFSEHAKTALDYAVNIANQFADCTIHLVHVYEVIGETGMMADVSQFISTQVEESLSKLVAETKTSLFHGTFLVAKAIEGSPIDLISLYADQLKVDYVVMGTQGASGLKEIFLGTNTLGVIKKVKAPVLAIPKNCKYQPLKKITLAIDSNIVSTSEVVESMVSLAKMYQAKVNVLHVGKAKELATIDAGVDIYLSEVNHAFHFTQDKNVVHGIHEFIKKETTDLLCLIRRKRNFLSSLFHNSVTKKEAFGSKVPLLVLHDL